MLYSVYATLKPRPHWRLRFGRL